MTAVKLPTTIPATSPASLVCASVISGELALGIARTEASGGSGSSLEVIATGLVEVLHEASILVEVDETGLSLAMLELDSSSEFQVTFKARYTSALVESLESEAGIT